MRSASRRCETVVRITPQCEAVFSPGFQAAVGEVTHHSDKVINRLLHLVGIFPFRLLTARHPPSSANPVTAGSQASGRNGITIGLGACLTRWLSSLDTELVNRTGRWFDGFTSLIQVSCASRGLVRMKPKVFSAMATANLLSVCRPFGRVLWPPRWTGELGCFPRPVVSVPLYLIY